MKISPAQADGFAARPDPAVKAVLVYGPDAGLVRERIDRLCRAVAGSLDDPFRLVDLTGAVLRDDPARLADEAAAIAMTGGRRAVRVLNAGDAVAGIFAAFLDHPMGDALVVVDGGELQARSKLRTLFEGAVNAAALACYEDDARGLEALIRKQLGEAGLRIAPEALEYLLENLGSDRLVTRSELEKLTLYMGESAKEVQLEDARASVGDSAGQSIDDAVLAAADGDRPGVERALARAFAESESPVGVIRAAQRHFQRLHLVAGAMAAGQPVERATAGLRPPLFWKNRARFLNQLRLWPAASIAQALDRLTAAEISCKTTGMPDEALCVRALLELAGFAERRRGNS
jgi:DNA polymerase-3 subunit delta